jgi:hypothetical protein
MDDKTFGIVPNLFRFKRSAEPFKVLFAAKPTKYLKNKIILTRKAALQ